VDVGAPLISHTQTSVLVKPGDGALDHPALSAEARAVRIAGPGNPDPHPAAVHLLAGGARMVGAIAVDLSRSSPRASAASFDRRNGVHHATKRVTSLTLAAVVSEANGFPLPQVIRWCLEPRFRRSTGLGPVRSPPQRHARGRSQPRPGASRSDRRS
jgi:hypothetical protein